MSNIGHNSSAGIQSDHLMAFIERIEHVEEEIKVLVEGKKEIYSEAKGAGFDVKIVREVVRIRKRDQDKRREEQEILELYLQALGMLA